MTAGPYEILRPTSSSTGSSATPAATRPRAWSSRCAAYRGFLFALGLVSIGGLFSSFVRIQQVYAVLGALFIPMLALALLVLNGRRAWIGREHRNGPLATALLVLSLGLFALFGLLYGRS